MTWRRMRRVSKIGSDARVAIERDASVIYGWPFMALNQATLCRFRTMANKRFGVSFVPA